MSIVAPELVTFEMKTDPLRAVFALRNPSSKTSFTGAFYALDCEDASGQAVTPGLLIVTTQDRAPAMDRLSAYDIQHVIEMNEAWAPGEVLNGDVVLNGNGGASISDCKGLKLRGAW